ncbi:MAG: 2'-5' RNA ligase family protein [Clostridia bacterium]|nr:2'-5' RNA ligase family protein [Clostridia bacterium]
MYIWLAADVSDPLTEVAERIRNHCNAQNLYNPCLTLPLHISLKISFPAEEEKAEAIIEKISAYLASLSPFNVKAMAPQREGNIVWLPMQRNEALEKIHGDLDRLLENSFSVPQHPFDKRFLFHTSLFLGENEENAQAFADRCTDFPLPDTLEIRRFVIGTSPVGKPGTYRVVHEINL